MPVTAIKPTVTAQPENSATLLATKMLETVEELAGLMRQEIDLVHERKFTDYSQFLRRKQQLTIDYRSGLKALAAQPGLFNPLSNDLRTALKDAAQKLAEASERNARQLRGAVLGMQRLVKTFVELVRDEVAIKPGYNNASAGAMQRGNYDIVCKPVVINRTA